MHRSFRRMLAVAAAGGLCLAGGAAAIATPAFGASAPQHAPGSGTATPIQHLVVIFQENVSFDHYFATYPHAANTDGNPFQGTTADQTSILAFIEDNWLGGQRIDNSSFDNLAGSLNDMFSWTHPSFAPYLLDPATGEPAR
jgi:Phosphoesterase family